MKTVLRNEPGEITHIRYGFFKGEEIFVSKLDEEILHKPIELDELVKYDADSPDVILMELLNEDITIEEVIYNIRKHLLTDVIKK